MSKNKKFKKLPKGKIYTDSIMLDEDGNELILDVEVADNDDVTDESEEKVQELLFDNSSDTEIIIEG